MKKVLLKMILVITAILFTAASGFAGDSVTISVSCTIPVIPGVNAPALTNENIRQMEPAKMYKPAAGQKQEVKKDETSLILQENTENEAKTEGGPVLVRTVYSR